MERKKIPKIIMLAVCICFLLIMAVPSFGAVQPPLDGTATQYLVNPLGLDTLVFFPNTLDVAVPSPFSQSLTNGYDTDTEEVTFVYKRDDPEPSEERHEYTVEPGTLQQNAVGEYVRSYLLTSDVFIANTAEFGFRNSHPINANSRLLSLLGEAVFALDPNCTIEYEVVIYGTYFPEVTPNEFRATPFNQNITKTFTNPNNYIITVPMFPQLSDYNSVISNEQIGNFVIDTYEITFFIYGPTSRTIDSVAFTMPFCRVPDIPSTSSLITDYGTTIVEGGDLSDAGAQLGNFFRNSVGGFLDAELFGNVTVGGIMATVFGILLFLAFLKIFAGG